MGHESVGLQLVLDTASDPCSTYHAASQLPRASYLWLQGRHRSRDCRNGRVSLRPVMPVIAQLIVRDAGRCGTPTRAELRSGTVLHLCISLDATGFGALQVTTLILFNPRLPQSSANVDIMGMGNVSDGGEGAIKLLRFNREVINTIITSAAHHPISVPMPDGETLPVHIKV